MKLHRVVVFAVLLCVAFIPLAAAKAPEKPSVYKVYKKWPFDAKEATRRQKESAKALGVPVQKTIDLGGGVKLKLVLIPAGEFMMGARDSAVEVARKCSHEALKPGWFKHEHPQHRVRITKPFYMGKYEVTQEQWEQIMRKNPSHFHGRENPVEQVSWNDCRDFLKKLTARLRSEGTFTLPTEAEWEYACRAGTQTPFYSRETISTDQANYDGNCTYGSGRKGVDREKTIPVGSFRPNAFGLYDMHGNVCEWCGDWYDGDYYEDSPREDPQGPARGDSRVVRGGSWFIYPGFCRSANRFGSDPGVRVYNGGVRVVFRDFR